MTNVKQYLYNQITKSQNKDKNQDTPGWNKKKEDVRCIIYPTDHFKQKWDILIIACAAYNSFLIPFDVSFQPLTQKTRLFIVIDFIIDFLFFADIIVTFRSVFINDRGQEVNRAKLIALNYIKCMFWVDLSATIPLDVILQSILKTDNPYYQAFGLLKLGRVLRLNKIIRYITFQNDIKSAI